MSGALVGMACLALLGGLVLLPPRAAFAALAVALVLVPDTLRLPFSDQLIVVRLAPLALLVGLLRRAGRGELAPRAFRPSPATAGLAGFALVAWVVGVMGADGPVPPTFARDAWLILPEQLVVLVAATAAVRTIGSVRAATTLAAVTVGAAAIAVAERITGTGYAQRIFDAVPEQRTADAGGRLEVRSGSVRPRVASRFSLAYAWQATILLPLVAGVAAGTPRARQVAGVGLVGLAVALTASRSAYAGLALGLVGLALLARRRSVTLAVAVAVAVGGLLVVGSGLADAAFDAPEASGSNAVRDERAPVVLDVAADDPFTGIGYGGLLVRGLPTTDSSWLQLYAELGAVGLAGLVLSVALAVAAMLPALTGATSHRPQRLVAAASATGLLLSLLGAAYFDLFTGRQSVLVLWVLAAIGVVAGEEAAALRQDPEPLGVGARLAARPLFPALGLAVGAVVFAIGPRPATAEVSLQTVPPATDAVAGGPDSFVGRTLANTTCAVLEAAASSTGADATCVLPFGQGAGAIRLRVASDDPARTDAAVEQALAAGARQVPSAWVLRLEREDRSLPAPVRTAPLAGAVGGLALAAVWPVRGRAAPRHDPAAAPPLPEPV